MVNLICGRAGSGKTSKVFEMISDDIAKDRRVILIVPEQETVLFETSAAKRFPPSSALNLEITNFKRLADLVARTYGGCGKNYISRSAACLYMHLAQLATKDLTETVKGDDESVNLLVSAISELKNSGIDAGKLETAAKKLTSDLESEGDREAKLALSQKLTDLALLMATFSELEREAGEDDGDILPNLANTLRKHDYFRGASVYVDSFFSLTPIEYDIAASMIRQAENITFTFAHPGDDSEEMQFDFTGRYYKTILSLASRYRSGKVNKLVLAGGKRAAKPAIAALDHIWDSEYPPYQNDAYGVEITLCRDKYEEAFAVLSKIKALLASGASAGEIAIITRDTSSVVGVIDAALEEAGIPYFLAERFDISSQPEIKLIFAALSTVSGGWRTDDLIAAVKTGLFPLSEREADVFERYLNTWDIRGRKRYTADAWSMNPDGFSANLTESGAEILTLANHAKEAIIPPLDRFADVFDKSPSVKDVCRAIWELLSELNVYEKCFNADETYSDREKEIKRQLPVTINSILDTLVSVLPDIKCDSRKFARLFKLASSDVNIGAIPAGLDRVTIGQANALRAGNISHAILIDVNEGIFPAAVSDDSFFSDHDKFLLEGADMPLPSGELERMEGELLWFYRSVTAASHGVYFFAAEENGALSSGATRVLELLPTLKVKHFDELTPEELIFDKSTLLDAAACLKGESRAVALDVLEKAGLGSYGINLDESAAQNARVSQETAEELFPNAKLYLSQSRLDSFIMCKFGYYCKYILKLKEERRAEIRAVDVGNFIHSMLEKFFSLQKDSAPLDEKRQNELIDELTDEYISANLGEEPPARSVNLFKRLRRSVKEMIRALSLEFASTDFKPFDFELPLREGDPIAPPPLHIPLKNGGEAVIGGIIDRLDVYREGEKTYVRVVDYKTGTKKFSLDDIRSGINMQLLIYLFSVCSAPEGDFRRSLAGSGELIPAGAIYFAASPAELKKNGDATPSEASELAGSAFTRSGILTDNVEILQKMDPDLSGKYIPIKLKKDGTFASGAQVASAAEFEKLKSELLRTVADISDEMRSGAAEAKPMKNKALDPCEWCKMNLICKQRKATT